MRWRTAAVKESTQPQGVIKIAEIRKVQIADVHKRKKFGFEIHTRNRTYPMAADSASVRKAWIVSILKAVEENKAMRAKVKKGSAQLHKALLSSSTGAGGKAKAAPWDPSGEDYASGTMIIVANSDDDDDSFDAGTMVINPGGGAPSSAGAADDDDDDFYNAGTMVLNDSDDESGTMIRGASLAPARTAAASAGGAKPSFLQYMEENEVQDDAAYLGQAESGKDNSRNWEGFSADELQAFAQAMDKQRDAEIQQVTSVFESLRIATLSAISERTD